MSWNDRRLNSVFTITTGDGKVYTPLWKSGETSKEFNTTIFDFINLEGALVDRKKVGPRKFPMIFWFQGEDNIEQANAFDLSANDNRAWKVQHPFYGDIAGQPLSISRNDNFFNVTEINVDFWETITETVPKQNISITDTTAAQLTEMNTVSPVDYAAKVQLRPADVVTVTDTATKINLLISNALDSINYSEYQLAKNEMFARIDDLILSPVDAIKALGFVISLPAQFANSVQYRIDLLQAVFNSFLNVLNLKPTRNNKYFFEAGGAATLSAICVALVNPVSGDYVTRTDVAAAGTVLTGLYAQYLSALNAAYVPISFSTTSFTPNYKTQALLQNTVITTISNLTTLAFNAKQERVVTLDKDSNLIILTHKYMGLDPDDANLAQFRTINNIKNKALFIVKKGKQIKYYV